VAGLGGMAGLDSLDPPLISVSPLSLGCWSDLAKITLLPLTISLPSFVQIRPVFEEIYPTVSSRLITISA